MNGFLGRILSPDNRLADTMMAVSGNAATSRMGQMGLAAIDERQAAAEADEKEARGVAQKIKFKVLDTSLQALQRPDLTEEQRAAIADDVMKLGNDLGVDVSPYLNIPAQQPEPMKVGGSLVKKTPEGYETVYTDPSKSQTRPSVLSPGAQLVDPEGNVLGENKNPRFAPPRPASQTPTGFKAQVKGEADAAYGAALKAGEGSTSLAPRTTIAHRFIDKRQANGFMSVAAADKAHKLINDTASGLIAFDRSHERVDAILKKDPAAWTAAAPAVSKALTSASQSAVGLIDLIPFVDPGLEITVEEWQDELTLISGDNREIQSHIFNIAIQEAISSGLASGRLSNDDIKRQIEDIGSNKAPSALRRRMKETRARMASRLDDRLRMTVEDFSEVSDEGPVAAQNAPADERARKIEEIRARRGMK